VSQVSYEAEADRVPGPEEDHRNTTGGSFRGDRSGGTPRGEYIYTEANEFRSKRIKGFGLTGGVAIFEIDVSIAHPTTALEGFLKYVI
jgi:hypothetical protein